MSKLQSFRLFLNQRLTAVAVEIFEAAQDTCIEYQKENDRLRRLLQISPEVQLSAIDSLQLFLTVSEVEIPTELPHPEQEWGPRRGQEDSEATQIKEEQEEQRTSQEEEQHQEVFHTKHAIFTSTSVKSDCDQEDPLQSWTPQTQTVDSRERDPNPPPDTPRCDTVTHLTGLSIIYDSPSYQTNASNHNSARNSNTCELSSSPQVDQSPPLDNYCSKPSTSSKTTHHCRDCGETYQLKANLQNHVTFSMRPSECSYCKKFYESTCKLRAHVQLCHVEKSYSMHKLTYTGEKPFWCDDLGNSFCLNREIKTHQPTHTREKPFVCGDCGKSFSQKRDLSRHLLIHTGEKPFSCGECGKRFNRSQNLKQHKLTHTREKPFSCGDCGKSFRHQVTLVRHRQTHTGHNPFISGYGGNTYLQPDPKR